MRNNYYTKILNWVLPVVVVLIILTGELIEGLVVLTAYIIYRFYNERDKFFSYAGKRKYLKGKLQKAVEYYERAYKTNQAEAKVRISYVYALILTKQYQKAEEALAETRNAQDANTIQTQMVICEGVLQWKEEGNLKGGMAKLNRLDDELKTSSYYGIMGKMMIAAGNVEKAREFNEEAYRYNRKNPGILENLIRIYCDAEEFERAAKVAKIFLKKKPNTYDAFYYCALSFEKIGNNRKAERLYKKARSFETSVLSSVKHNDI